MVEIGTGACEAQSLVCLFEVIADQLAAGLQCLGDGSLRQHAQGLQARVQILPGDLDLGAQ
ncbi:hypothetical protein D3C77_755640 [compost metagenome]